MNSRQPWAIVLLWVLATVVGIMIGIPGVLTLVTRLALSQAPPVAANALGGAGMGAVLGLAQWLVLRRYVAAAFWWVPASAIGAAIGAAMGMAAADAVGPMFVVDTSSGRPATPGLRPVLQMAATAGISGAGVGLCMGIAQWVFLRRAVAGAGRWIVASALGWPAALAIGAACSGGGGFLAGLLVAGIVSGSTTGAMLARLVGIETQPASPPTAYGGSQIG